MRRCHLSLVSGARATIRLGSTVRGKRRFTNCFILVRVVDCFFGAVRMVYYIRFLKTPRYQQQKKAVYISALVCITTDLGDDFLAEDVDLVATWVQYPSQKVLHRGLLKWEAGSRQLPIMLGPFSSNNVVQQTACLTIQSKDAQRDTLGDHSTPLVISGCSAPFGPQSEAEKLILRTLHVADRDQPLSIWEETGNSIARHIWYISAPSFSLTCCRSDKTSIGMRHSHQSSFCKKLSMAHLPTCPLSTSSSKHPVARRSKPWNLGLAVALSALHWRPCFPTAMCSSPTFPRSKKS